MHISIIEWARERVSKDVGMVRLQKGSRLKVKERMDSES